MSTTTLREQAYQYIQGKILSGGIGAGQVVSEHALAKEIGVSRTPVREALRQLEAEGLVEQVPRFGVVVRRPDRRDLVELYQLRMALESFVARQAAQQISALDAGRLQVFCEELQRIMEQLSQRDLLSLDVHLMRRFLAADMGFHALIIQAAGNRRITKLISDSRVLAQVFGVPRQMHDLEVVTETWEFHTHIFQAVSSGDPASAAQWMERHIETSLARTLQHYDQTSSRHPELPAMGLPPELAKELSRIEKQAADLKRG